MSAVLQLQHCEESILGVVPTMSAFVRLNHREGSILRVATTLSAVHVDEGGQTCMYV